MNDVGLTWQMWCCAGAGVTPWDMRSDTTTTLWDPDFIVTPANDANNHKWWSLSNFSRSEGNGWAGPGVKLKKKINLMEYKYFCWGSGEAAAVNTGRIINNSPVEIWELTIYWTHCELGRNPAEEDLEIFQRNKFYCAQLWSIWDKFW